MAKHPKDLLHGTLDVLVLRTLADGPAHGYGITRAIESRSGDELPIEDAALYKALRRLEAAGTIASAWGTSDNNRRARFYRLTAKGHRELRAESMIWRRFAAAVHGVLDRS